MDRRDVEALDPARQRRQREHVLRVSSASYCAALA